MTQCEQIMDMRFPLILSVGFSDGVFCNLVFEIDVQREIVCSSGRLAMEVQTKGTTSRK